MRAHDAVPLVARLAERQGGPVSRAQLLALGLSRSAIGRQVAAGRLHRIFPSVYAVGHRAMTPRGWLMAAVLAGGPGAVASHRSAAWLHGLLQTSRSKHDVTTRRHRRSAAVDFHEGRLRREEVTNVDDVPCTTVARTLLDLADVVPRRLVERAMEQAEVRRVLDVRDLEAVLRRANGRRGTGVLGQLLAGRAGPALTRSELEERFLALVREHGLPEPRLNHRVGDFEVDALWPEHRLIVELDGAATHLTAVAFERDRARDARLTAAGYRVVRFTWRQIADDPAGVAGILRRLLGH